LDGQSSEGKRGYASHNAERLETQKASALVVREKKDREKKDQNEKSQRTLGKGGGSSTRDQRRMGRPKGRRLKDIYLPLSAILSQLCAGVFHPQRPKSKQSSGHIKDGQ